MCKYIIELKGAEWTNKMNRLYLINSIIIKINKIQCSLYEMK